MIKINVTINITQSCVYYTVRAETCCCQQIDWGWGCGGVDGGGLCVCVRPSTNLRHVHGFTFSLPSVKPRAVRIKFGFPLYWLEFTGLPW